MSTKIRAAHSKSNRATPVNTVSSNFALRAAARAGASPSSLSENNTPTKANYNIKTYVEPSHKFIRGNKDESFPYSSNSSFQPLFLLGESSMLSRRFLLKYSSKSKLFKIVILFVITWGFVLYFVGRFVKEYPKKLVLSEYVDDVCIGKEMNKGTYCLTKKRDIIPPFRQGENMEALCEVMVNERNDSDDRIAVGILTANRPKYLRQQLDSIQKQSTDKFDLFIFVDRIDGNDDNKEVIHLARDFSKANVRVVDLPGAPIGVARLTFWAIRTMFGHRNQYNSILVLEDDHLLGHTYIEAMRLLLGAAEHMDDVAVVNGNFMDTPKNQATTQRYNMKPVFMERDDEKCLFQVAPLISIPEINSHNVWAWATTREKWNRVDSDMAIALEESGLDKAKYDDRDKGKIVQIMDNVCPQTGYRKWPGQDWLRACIFHSHSMTFKLQPTQRFMSYIGKEGIHMDEKRFERSGFNSTTAAEVSHSLENFGSNLCRKTCILSKGVISF